MSAIRDLILEKAALWVQSEADPDILFCTDVEEDYHDLGRCDCCGDSVSWYCDVTYEVPKKPDETFYAHVKVVRFSGRLSTFIDFLDKRHP